ncbi:MAG: RluA family pseudouridine synthase [Candidatus Algichlamydia australiensis]|nr:RluA family pseudouridine synthase [Chlamydiales bacterium]
MNILVALEKEFPDSSKSTLRSMIQAGRVVVAGHIVKNPSTPVDKKEKIDLLPRATYLDHNLKILFSDQDLVVVDKPIGLLSVDDTKGLNPSVHSILKRHYPTRRIFPVHRLDRDTSGILVFACNEKTKEELKEQFAAHAPERIYYAVVEGHLKEKKGKIKSYLSEDTNFFVRSGKNGKLAITHYEVLKESKNLSYLRVKLETGRKNQIRVHLSEKGHPIVGDRKYGSICNPLKRLALHAERLRFFHPRKGKEIFFTSPIPWDILGV